ncbi:hypothetical protein LTR86_005827 [Recurvomyces mirabilis]|nr:hypothetical protein LTR86_005827 [Recurvomyces mirabilis]
MPTSFLSLSAELRNTIYDLVIGKVSETWMTDQGKYARGPALLATTRKIRSETLPMYEARCQAASGHQHYHVHNFDFTYMLPIFDNARQQELLAPKALKVKIHFSVDPDFDLANARASIEPWLRLCGTHIDVDAHNYRCRYVYLVEPYGKPPNLPKELSEAFGKRSALEGGDRGSGIGDVECSSTSPLGRDLEGLAGWLELASLRAGEAKWEEGEEEGEQEEGDFGRLGDRMSRLAMSEVVAQVGGLRFLYRVTRLQKVGCLRLCCWVVSNALCQFLSELDKDLHELCENTLHTTNDPGRAL